MSIQNRVSITLSPRMRKALELAAGLDGSSTATYTTQLLTAAIKKDINDSSILLEKWIELEKQAMKNESWDTIVLPMLIDDEQQGGLMKGWFLAGDNPDAYTVGTDNKKTYKGVKSGFIKSKSNNVNGFGTLMQQTNIKPHIGKKLRVTAAVNTEKVKRWAGVWARVDDEDNKVLWFDNMQSHPIKGTTDWRIYQLTFDVPKESAILSLGVLLVGEGDAWINKVTLMEVTGSKQKIVDDLSTNLDF